MPSSKYDRKLTEERGIFPLPLVIGVTGHRDLREEDREPLEAQVRQVFDDLQKSRYLKNTPLLLLSALAEGADQLVARVALEKGIRLIVLLPMPRTLYEEDFQTEVSRNEFNQLLQQAERFIELPLLNGVHEEEVRHSIARNQQYAQVGAYITLHSQILLALWDGIDIDQVGGTSQIVHFQLQGTPEAYTPLYRPLDEPESGSVYHIVTPRMKNPTPVGRPFELYKLNPIRSTHSIASDQDHGADQYGCNRKNTGKKQRNGRSHDAAKQEYDHILDHLGAFNRDGIDLGTRLAEKQEQSKSSLLGDISTSTLPDWLKVTLDRYARLYAIADTLAIYFKERTVNTLLSLFSLFFIAVICFNVYAHLGEYLAKFLGGEQRGRFLFLALYLVFLSIAYYLWYYRTSKGHYKNKFLDYRALAEGLRVQFFWCLGGVPDPVAAHYLRKQKSELDWIRKSIRSANLLCDARDRRGLHEFSVYPPDNCYQLILKQWVDDQSRYFTAATSQDRSKQEVNEWWVRGLFLTGMVLALGLLILHCFSLLMGGIDNGLLVNLLIVIMSLVLVLAALKEGYADKMAFAEQVKQYQRMSRLFWLASQHLEDSLVQGKSQDAKHLIRELGEEALAENGDWVILHRARPINVPKGG
jgi:hypothetical protein